MSKCPSCGSELSVEQRLSMLENQFTNMASDMNRQFVDVVKRYLEMESKLTIAKDTARKETK